jgi:hypothetical protein
MKGAPRSGRKDAPCRTARVPRLSCRPPLLGEMHDPVSLSPIINHLQNRERWGDKHVT